MLNNSVAGLILDVSGNASLVKSYSPMLNFKYIYIYTYNKYKNL